MTIVVACRFLKTATVFADCRVSYADGRAKEVDDNLQKIYQIHDRLILGFSGPLSGAYHIMEVIRKNMRNYSKPPVAVNLKRDMERWIRHKYRELEAKDRKNLSFLLASVEPSREAYSKWRTSDGEDIPKPDWFGPDPPEIRILALKPRADRPDQLRREEGGICQIIGVRGGVVTAVKDVMLKWFGFLSEDPEKQAIVVGNVLMATLMREKIDTVGGLFQLAVLGAEGIQF